MNFKKHMKWILIAGFLYVTQIIIIEHSFSSKTKQLIRIQDNLIQNIDSLNAKLQLIEEEIYFASCQNFVNLQKIPNSLTFCGEVINLKNPLIREKVEREFYSLLNNQGQIQLYLKRLGRYEKLIVSQLREANLPLDLKYLSIHESALLPQIKSHAKAVGLWQFMYSTARLYKLKVDKYFDERCDPEKATHAATQYLGDLYKRFGNWPLVLAAYNGGPSRVKNALNRQNTDDFLSLTLPEETERYYFKIVATKIILSEPEKYGFRLAKSEFYYPYSTDKIEFTVYENRKFLSEISSICNTNLATFKELNPSIKSEVLPAGKYQFNIYKKDISAFDRNFYNYSDSFIMMAKVKSDSSNTMID